MHIRFSMCLESTTSWCFQSLSTRYFGYIACSAPVTLLFSSIRFVLLIPSHHLWNHSGLLAHFLVFSFTCRDWSLTGLSTVLKVRWGSGSLTTCKDTTLLLVWATLIKTSTSQYKKIALRSLTEAITHSVYFTYLKKATVTLKNKPLIVTYDLPWTQASVLSRLKETSSNETLLPT